MGLAAVGIDPYADVVGAVVDKPGHPPAQFDLRLVTRGVVLVGGGIPFRIGDGNQVVAAVILIGCHAAQRIGHRGAVTQAVVGVAGPVAFGIDVGCQPVVEVVLHAHHALFGGAGGIAMDCHVAHGIVVVFGADAVGIDLGDQVAVGIVLIGGGDPGLDTAAIHALQPALFDLVTDRIVNRLDLPPFGVDRGRLAVGQVVGIVGDPRLFVGGLDHLGAVADGIVIILSKRPDTVGHAGHAIRRIEGEAAGDHMGAGGLVGIVGRILAVNEVLTVGHLHLVAEHVVGDGGGEAFGVGGTDLLIELVEGIGGGAGIAAVGPGPGHAGDVAARIIGVDGHHATGGDGLDQLADSIERADLHATVGVDDLDLVTQGVVGVLGHATLRIGHLDEVVVQVIDVVGVARFGQTHRLGGLQLVAGPIINILGAGAQGIGGGDQTIVVIVFEGVMPLFGQPRRLDGLDPVAGPVIDILGAFAFAVGLGNHPVVGVILRGNRAFDSGHPAGQGGAQAVAVGVIAIGGGDTNGIGFADNAVNLVVEISGNPLFRQAIGIITFQHVTHAVTDIVCDNAIGIDGVGETIGRIEGKGGGALIRRALRIDDAGPVTAIVIGIGGGDPQGTGFTYQAIVRIVIKCSSSTSVTQCRDWFATDRHTNLVVVNRAAYTVADRIITIGCQDTFG